MSCFHFQNFRCIYFHPDGTCLYSGVKDFLKVYGWEPTQCYDSVPISWGEVADMSIAQNQLVNIFLILIKFSLQYEGCPRSS